MSKPSSVDARLAYKNAAESLAKQGLDPSRAVLTQSYLRSEITLDPNTTNYQIPILNNQQITNGSSTGVISPTEQRLNLQDSFFVSRVGVFINVTATTYDGFKDWLVPFSSAALGQLIDLDRIRAVWNSKMKLTIDQKVKVPAWFVNNHYCAPMGQRPMILQQPAIFQYSDQLDGSEDGFYPCEPGWWFIGADNIELTYTLPHALGVGAGGAILASTVTVKLVTVFQGILAQNSTSVR